jgi:hypothetical protein
MGMFHPTSGKTGFYYFKHSKTPVVIEKSVVIEMLKYEQELRQSPEYQRMFTEADTDCYKLENIVIDLQRKVISKFKHLIPVDHLKDQNNYIDDYLLLAFRNSRYLYKDDPDVNTLTDYFLYDKSRPGVLKAGDPAPCGQDIELFDLEKKSFSLADFYQTNKPVVVYAGSYS